MSSKSSWLLLAILFLFFDKSFAQRPAIIPRPVKMEMTAEKFLIDGQTGLHFDKSKPELAQAARFLSTHIYHISGLQLPSNGKQSKQISLSLINDPAIGNEGYVLEVTHNRISIKANRKEGVLYGIQSLIQMLPAVRTNTILEIPGMRVTDYPRFTWRGMHLDVSRHFFSPETVKEYIELMSLYKFNRFHWHLTDDQGWRIEIKKYPKLTEVGAWRAVRKGIPWSMSQPDAPGEPRTYGGFYTQSQVRDIVRFAKERNITIVPEIDVPGHSGAAIAAYPFLGCSGKPQQMITGGVYPDSTETSLCVAKDTVYGFLKNVLTEIMDLFPSEYIHIGGDEVNKTPWKNDSLTQRFMRARKIADEDALQSYFIHQMEVFLNSKGRKLIGWDEILEGGLAPDATVMSWRGESGGIQAAKQHHNVVMTPGNPLYFDHYQAGPEGEPEAFGGMNTLKMVYDYNPVPKELSEAEAKYVLGAQANLWAEMIYSRAHVEYMILPRMLALSETVWTPLQDKDYEDFFKRVQVHFDAFDHLGLNYCEGNYNVKISPVNDQGKLSVALSSEDPEAIIYYSTDGSWPDASSQVYKRPFAVDSSMNVKAVVAVNGVIKTRVPSEQEFVMDKLTGKTVSYTFPYSSYYPADGPNSLTDGIRGKHAVGKYWHGFAGKDMIATIDMESAETVHQVTAGFLQRYSDWIFLPASVKVETSEDGVNFSVAGIVQNDVSVNESQSTIKDFVVNFPARTARYIRVTAKNIGVCPPGHPGAGKPAWIFADEIIAK